MEKSAIKDIIYGSLFELMKNPKYYYYSTVGAGYSHLTEEGEKALVEYMSLMLYKLHESENAELDTRAKNLVIKGLKGE